MKYLLESLSEHRILNEAEACEVLHGMAADRFTPSQVASFLTVFLMRALSVDEIAGFRKAMLELAVPVQLEFDKAVDVCGTGGDGKNTFNISTLSAFILAGAGCNVVKHGNYGVSSRSGSSHVMERAGLRFTRDRDTLQRQLDVANICFLHAPLFHPALKKVASVRKELGLRTFFNLLGPLVNPARPTHQFTGVFNAGLARIYRAVLNANKTEFRLVYTFDGYDEISLTGIFRITDRDRIADYHPGDFSPFPVTPADIAGGDTVESAFTVFKNVLQNRATPAQRQVAVINAAFAMQCMFPEYAIAQCIEQCEHSLVKGHALHSLQKLVELNN